MASQPPRRANWSGRPVRDNSVVHGEQPDKSLEARAIHLRVHCPQYARLLPATEKASVLGRARDERRQR
jgi:hypothetical protein